MHRKIEFSPPDIGREEIEEVVGVLRSGWITTGPKTRELETMLAKYCGTSRVVCLNSATAALELTLRLLDIGPGDEVITTPYTYTATASVVLHVGATPVFADTAPGSFLLDADAAARAFTEKTKAVIGVDVGGRMCDYDALLRVTQANCSRFVPRGKLQQALGRAAVIADAAHSLGATCGKRMSGACADFSAFSFHAVKNLTTAEGGAVTWNLPDGIENEELYKEYFLIALHGQNKDALHKAMTGGWEYDILLPGYKHNLPDVLAAIGVAQLRRYPSLLARRAEITALYDRLLQGRGILLPQQEGAHFSSSRHLYLARVPGCTQTQRNRIIEHMARQGVSANVHYKPLPMLTAYRERGYRAQNYPNACAQYENEVTLPLHTLLSDEDVQYVAQSFVSACESVLG